MPAKRSPKKSRRSTPSPVDVNLADLDTGPVLPVEVPTVEVPPAAPAPSTFSPAAPTPSGATPPKAGPPVGRDARLAGRSQRAGQNRFYAFRRS
ncbi:hypothetical protein [Micromonospora auratinigra]|uniref:Uncharacterized protein n=1 Tax=Micromonospora auratinigra TaxID=261654 RepID=A0A1A8ZQ08_9ACTN|nr:hypothetical protein [Micromonospora auratinigra]SBT45912.1 hypothetical protein GA0070611_3197 [Micromonospora auratinigra]